VCSTLGDIILVDMVHVNIYGQATRRSFGGHLEKADDQESKMDLCALQR
jgi:hypothetical protein